MKNLREFVKTTLLGGLVVLLPVAAVLVLFERVVATVRAGLEPLESYLPVQVFFPGLVASLIVAGLCFMVGLVVRTAVGQRVRRAVEGRVFERVPGYTLLRSLSRRMIGEEEGVTFAVALAEIEEALVPAFIVEEHEDGSFTVFVPAVPTPTIGAIYILPRERVHRIEVPFGTAVRCVTNWGAGSGELLRAMRRT
jgi:uncharacterized membrane protein